MGSASRALPNSLIPLFPIVGLQTSGEVIEANFGQQPFLFDFGNYLKDLRYRTRNEVLSHPIAWPGSVAGHVRSLVLSYLCHAGYASTAEALSKSTNCRLPEELEVVRSRQRKYFYKRLFFSQIYVVALQICKI